MLLKSPGPYLWILFLLVLFLLVLLYGRGFTTLEYKGKALNVLMMPLFICSFFALSSWAFGDWVDKEREAKERAFNDYIDKEREAKEPEDRKSKKPNE